MKLLVVSQYFYPEQFGVNDICSKLVALGHNVTVLTGLPNYPMGEIFDGYQWDRLRGEEEVNGVKVLRCRLHPRKKGKKALVINYISFAYHASLIARNIAKSAKSSEEIPFDRVLVTQYSPVTMAIPAIIIKHKLKIPFILYCFDLWPESIVSVGLKNYGFFYNTVKVLSRYIYKKADEIIISSRNFEIYLRDKLDIEVPITYIPMYAEDVFTSVNFELRSISKASVCNLMFAGNIGKMQSIDTIIKASAELKNIYLDDSTKPPAFPIIFHMVGDGSALQENIDLAKELGVFLSDSQLKLINQGTFTNLVSGVVFHGRHPLEEMPEFYNMADAMLITMKKDDVISYTLPNKVQTYMAAGKPIIAAIDGEAFNVIGEANCGYVCGAEDYITFAHNILAFAESLLSQSANGQKADADSKFAQYGRNSRDYYEKHFSADNFIKSLLQVLE